VRPGPVGDLEFAQCARPGGAVVVAGAGGRCLRRSAVLPTPVRFSLSAGAAASLPLVAHGDTRAR
jgi:hypothetical protein